MCMKVYGCVRVGSYIHTYDIHNSKEIERSLFFPSIRGGEKNENETKTNKTKRQNICLYFIYKTKSNSSSTKLVDSQQFPSK